MSDAAASALNAFSELKARQLEGVDRHESRLQSEEAQRPFDQTELQSNAAANTRLFRISYFARLLSNAHEICSSSEAADFACDAADALSRFSQAVVVMAQWKQELQGKGVPRRSLKSNLKSLCYQSEGTLFVKVYLLAPLSGASCVG